jgi:antitoxin ParD1/3/4
MAKVVKRTFSLTEEQAKFIDDRVSDGQYATASEVVREGLRGLQEDAAIFDERLRREVLPVIERLRSGREKVVTPEQVRANLKDEYERLLKARR